MAGSLEPADASTRECTGRWLAYLYPVDQREIDASDEHLLRMQALLPLMPRSWSHIIAIESAYQAGWWHRDGIEAQRWLDRVPTHGLIPSYDRLRANAAVAVAQGQIEKARKLLEEDLSSIPANALWVRDRLAEMRSGLEKAKEETHQ